MHRGRIVTLLQRGEGDHGLEGRAGRIVGRERLVEQRLAVVFRQRLIFRPGQPLDEGVGVEAGRRGQAQDVAGAAIHHHRRAALLAEHLQRPVLDIGVEGQADRRAGGRRDIAVRILPDHAALDVHLHLARPGLAAQIEVVGFLDPLLADAEAGIEHDRIGVGAGLADVLGVDLGHIADHVGEGAAKGIDPHLAHVGGDAGKLRRPDVDAGELLPAHVLHHGHRRLARGVGDIVGQAVAAGLVHGHQLGKVLDDRIDIGVLVAGQKQAEGRAVGRQHHAVAVEDQAPGRRREPILELVLVREHLVAAGFQDLQMGQARAEHRQPRARHAAEQEGAPVEQRLALVHLVKIDRRFDHRKRTSWSS